MLARPIVPQPGKDRQLAIRTVTRPLASLCAVVLVVAACGGQATTAPTGDPSASAAGLASSGPVASVGPVASGPVAVGPFDVPAPTLDASTDLLPGLATLAREDQDRLRGEAGFPGAVGPGWEALETTLDDAVDAAVETIGEDLGVDVPTAGRHRLVASVGPALPSEPVAPDSAASAMAIVTAALTAGAALGSGGTRDTSTSETRTTTRGDDVATVTVEASGTVTSSGSRVEADFTFDITGTVTNSVSGATADMTGSATAHVEIDGCPDANGKTGGRMTLSSQESASGDHDAGAGTASWSRDLSGDFTIAVDDNANLSGLVLDANASESVVTGGEDPDEGEGHDLGMNLHFEMSSPSGIDGLAVVPDASRGEVTNERNATAAHLEPLARSAGYAISVAAISLGRAAEAFWRDGKCLDLTVDPEGGDVDADSVTDVVATLKHHFEGTELDKPVTATLAGVAAVDPAGERQPAPATVRFTAGSVDGDTGEIAFESVSNRGIARKAVTFTVRPAAWDVTFEGTQREVLGPVANDFKATITGLRITAQDGVLSGSGELHLRGKVVSGPCTGTLDQVAPISATGTLEGTDAEAELVLTLRATSPPGDTTRMRCRPGGGADLPAEGYAERFGEPLRDLRLPAAGGTTPVSSSTNLGPVRVTVKGTFTTARVAACG